MCVFGSMALAEVVVDIGMVAVPVGIAVIGRRLQADFCRRPAEVPLEPATEERRRCQETDSSQLPPEIRDLDELQAAALAGGDPGPSRIPTDGAEL